MSYRISAMDSTDITLNETDAVKSIIQNIRMILKTVKGTVPLDRSFGISKEVLHRPINVAKVMLRSEIKEAIETYEPRATVIGVDFSVSESKPDALNAIVEVDISE